MLTIRRDQAALHDRAAGLLDQAKAAAKARVVDWASAVLSPFTAGYPKEEVMSWPTKLAAARRVLAGEREPMIETEAWRLGVEPDHLAKAVVRKGARYEIICAEVAGIRGRAYDAINQAASVDAVDSAAAQALSQAAADFAALDAAATPKDEVSNDVSN